MKKSVAIVALVLFTSLYFAPVVGAVVTLNGDTHICAETGKVCKNKKMCMKIKRDKEHAGAMHHKGAVSTNNDNHKKNEAPSHKSCKERLSCGGGEGAFSMVLKRITFEDSLISLVFLGPSAFGASMKLCREDVKFKDSSTPIPERPPQKIS